MATTDADLSGKRRVLLRSPAAQSGRVGEGATSPVVGGERRVVVCADDYGMSDGVSSAVLHLASQGCLSATSAMVLSPRWREDARRLIDLRGKIDVGLHLDWTSDFARAAGHGLGLGAAMRRALLGGFDQALARTEIERQLDGFEAAWGAPPDHIDGHQHVQQFAGIRQTLLELVVRRYGRAESDRITLPWLRVSRPTAQRFDVKGKVISALGAGALTAAAAREGVPVSPVLSGIYGFDAGAGAYAHHMARWLAEIPDHAVLMCHPSAKLEAGDEISAARVREFEFLKSAAFAESLRSAGVRVVRGSEIYLPANSGLSRV